MVDTNWLTRTDWLVRTDWLWTVIGGFYLVAYLYWYIPVLKELPQSVGDPPAPYPWHWPLDFLATGMAGAVLLFLGFRRATELTRESTAGTAGTAGMRPDAEQERTGIDGGVGSR